MLQFSLAYSEHSTTSRSLYLITMGNIRNKLKWNCFRHHVVGWTLRLMNVGNSFRIGSRTKDFWGVHSLSASWQRAPYSNWMKKKFHLSFIWHSGGISANTKYERRQSSSKRFFLFSQRWFNEISAAHSLCRAYTIERTLVERVSSWAVYLDHHGDWQMDWKKSRNLLRKKKWYRNFSKLTT